MLNANIRQHAVKKKAASEVEPSQPLKRHQAPAPVDVSTSTVELDAPSTSVPEPVLALSAPTVLLAVSSEERAVRGNTETTSIVPPPEEVQAEAREPEQSVAASVASSVGVQSSSSFPSLSNMGLPTTDRGKAPMTSVEKVASKDHMIHFDLQVPVDESALVNSILAKRLCQATLFLADREHRRKRSVVEIFSSFYSMIIGVSFFDRLFFFFFFFKPDLSSICS